MIIIKKSFFYTIGKLLVLAILTINYCYGYRQQNEITLDIMGTHYLWDDFCYEGTWNPAGLGYVVFGDKSTVWTSQDSRVSIGLEGNTEDIYSCSVTGVIPSQGTTVTHKYQYSPYSSNGSQRFDGSTTYVVKIVAPTDFQILNNISSVYLSGSDIQVAFRPIYEDGDIAFDGGSSYNKIEVISSNNNVISVVDTDGNEYGASANLKACGKGTATITIKAYKTTKDKTRSYLIGTKAYTIDVVDDLAAQSFEFTREVDEIEIGKYGSFNISPLPSGYIFDQPTATLSNDNGAIIYENRIAGGKILYRVLGVKEGQTTLTVTLPNGFSDSRTINIKKSNFRVGETFICPISNSLNTQTETYLTFEVTDTSNKSCIVGTSVGNPAFDTKTTQDAEWGLKLPEYAYDYKVIGIGDQAFKGFFNLKQITIPSTIDHIGNEAFQGCCGLTTLYIGENVSAIGEKAFDGCRRLEEIFACPPLPPAAEENVFPTEVYDYSNLYIQENSLNSYKSSSPWNKFLTVKPLNESDAEIAEITDDELPVFDIYNLYGICLKRNASRDDIALFGPGIYIINGKKIYVK